MSRCFPFPPPGYIKKARTEDLDLLKKEDREKKHKKDKKDKDKRESKEKRDKDKSDGKHRDKKDKKEKLRDKKVEKKERDKDKEKSIASDEKRLSLQSELNNGDKASDERKLPGKPEVHNGETLVQKGKERDIHRNSVSSEKKFGGQFLGYNGDKLSNNSHLAEHPKDPKYLQDLGRRARDGDKATGNLAAERFTGVDAKREEYSVRLVAKGNSIEAEGMEKNKRGDDRMLNGRYIRDEARFTGNTMAQSLSGMVQTRTDGMPRLVDKDIERMMEWKVKNSKKEGDDECGDKCKDKEKAQKGQGKDKEKNKDEKANEKSMNKNREPDKSKEKKKDELIGQNVKPLLLPKESTKNAAVKENIRKRKDVDTNGFLRANDIKPSKLPRPTSASHLLAENGRILETCQTSIPFISDSQRVASNLKMDGEHKINGVIETQALSMSSTTQLLSIATTKALRATAQANKTAEVCRKLPHPDSKYLSDVLTLPKMEEWSDLDDQEWLFQSSNSQSKNPKVCSSGVEEAPQVWSEALSIDSADICALPYVIPY